MNSSFSDVFVRYELIPATAIAGPGDFVLGMHCLSGYGLSGYGLDKSSTKALDRLPVQQISTPILDNADDALFERWLTDSPCRYGRFEDIEFRRTDTLLFGVIEIDESKLEVANGESSLRVAAEKAYQQIFALLDAEGFRHLWRTWNYMPAIHAEECGLERYRQFNVGRHNAFVGRGKAVDHSPAASALGTHDGVFSVAFIAGHATPKRIENPRQVSAFEYPEQYGPRSPTFTRAVTIANTTHEALFISGTASIVGHETLHCDDVTAQTRETIANLAALLEQANGEPANIESPPYPFTLQNLGYRIYIRHANDFDKVRAVFDDVIGTSMNIAYVQADICRQDLLIEIEAFAIRALAV